MKFRDLVEGRLPKEEAQEVTVTENEVKFQALAKMKEIQSALADLTFLDVIAVMNPENPLKKEVQKMETQINDLTKVVGDFVEANMADATEVGDEPEEPEEETEEPEEDKAKEEK